MNRRGSRGSGALDEHELAVTVERAGRLLRISRQTAYIAVRQGRIPSFRIGRSIRVPAAALRKMLDGGGYQKQPGRKRQRPIVPEDVHAMSTLTAEQIRAARALLRMQQSELAQIAGLHVETVRGLEGQTGPVGATSKTIEAVQTALRRKGVHFIDASPEAGPGVRLLADLSEWTEGAPGALCPKCRKPKTPEGHDPCIANLPGVKFACCGHGVRDGYLFFENGTRIGMRVLGIDKHDIPTDRPAP